MITLGVARSLTPTGPRHREPAQVQGQERVRLRWMARLRLPRLPHLHLLPHLHRRVSHPARRR